MRLAEHASSQVAISDAEWRKHLRRDLVIAVPFELHSALQLSVRRAMLAWADGDFTSYAERFAAISLISVAPNQADRLISALNDDSVLADNGWSLEKVIPAIELDSSGRRKAAEPDHYSAIELRAKSSQETIELLLEIFPGRPWFKPTGYGVGEGPNFYQFLTSTLVQMHLDVAIYFSEEETGNDRRRKQRLIVGSASVPDLPRGLGYFRPLFFVPYRDDLVTLKDPASTSVNASHPLAQWLIGRAEPLDREAPVLLARLTDALEAAPSETNTNEANRLLDDLRVAFPKLVLADELHIRFEAGQWK
jgi:hypothetical protein